MVPAVVLSMIAAMLSILAFCLVRWPMGWIRLWSPFRAFLARPYLSPPERDMLPGIRVRAALAGIALLAIAMVLPAAGATYFRFPARALGAAPMEPPIPQTVPARTEHAPSLSPQKSL